jgi:hypothetical protein
VPKRADVLVPERADVRVPERADERADERAEQSARPATVWFAAKRPSASDARSEEELDARWQPTTQAWPAAGQASQSRTDDLATMPEQSGLTSSGLPRRVPRTSAYPGSGIPDFGLPAVPVTPAAEVPVLGAPPGGMARRGVSYAGAQNRERVPARRRSPEAARSRLSGFQLGSRDAGQAGHAAVARPLAGEENKR